MGSYPSGQRRLTVNQLGYPFGGSNPSLPTGQNGIEPERPAYELTRRVARERQALIAQLVERALGKGKVMGSNPIEGSLSRLIA